MDGHSTGGTEVSTVSTPHEQGQGAGTGDSRNDLEDSTSEYEVSIYFPSYVCLRVLHEEKNIKTQTRWHSHSH